MKLQSQKTEALSNDGARMDIFQAGTKRLLTHEKEGHEEEQPMYLLLLGPDSTKTQQEMAKVRNRAKKREDVENYIPDDEALEDERVKDSRMLSRLTTGGEVFWDDSWVTVDTDLAYTIFYEISSVRAQALQFIMSRENFTKG